MDLFHTTNGRGSSSGRQFHAVSARRCRTIWICEVGRRRAPLRPRTGRTAAPPWRFSAQMLACCSCLSLRALEVLALACWSTFSGLGNAAALHVRFAVGGAGGDGGCRGWGRRKRSRGLGCGGREMHACACRASRRQLFKVKHTLPAHQHTHIDELAVGSHIHGEVNCWWGEARGAAEGA